MNKRISASLIAAALLFSAGAKADEAYQEMRPYVSGMYSYVFEDDRRDENYDAVLGGTKGVDAGQGAEFSVGKALNRYWGIELAAFGHNYDHNRKGDVNFRDYGGKISGLFFYSRDPAFSPYFILGAGSIQTNLKGLAGEGTHESTDPYADVGLGFMKFFDVAGFDMGFRTDLRYRRIFFKNDAFGPHDAGNTDDLGEGVLNVGFVVPLGPKPITAVPPKPAPEQPRPPSACPDSDGDGVCDNADLCPDTPKGTPVDAKGCPLEKKVKVGDPNQKFEDVHFAFDKSDLTDYSKALLDNAAKVISSLVDKYPGLKVDVSGHTDWIGTDGYNQGLSERRANVVKQYLVRKGVDGGRITTYAYGETKPVATNETEEGRALNRRTEVRTREK